MIPPIRRLHHWEECVGVLTELSEGEGILIAKMGKMQLGLPIDMAEVLNSHLGQRIGILCTNISNKPYLIRIVGKDSPVGAGNTDIGDEHSAQTTGAIE